MISYNGKAYIEGRCITEEEAEEENETLTGEKHRIMLSGEEENFSDFITRMAKEGDDALLSHITEVLELTPLIDFGRGDLKDFLYTDHTAYLQDSFGYTYKSLCTDRVRRVLKTFSSTTESTLCTLFANRKRLPVRESETGYLIDSACDLFRFIDNLASGRSMAGPDEVFGLGPSMSETFYGGAMSYIPDDIKKTYDSLVIAAYKKNLSDMAMIYNGLSFRREVGELPGMPSLRDCVEFIRKSRDRDTEAGFRELMRFFPEDVMTGLRYETAAYTHNGVSFTDIFASTAVIISRLMELKEDDVSGLLSYCRRISPGSMEEYTEDGLLKDLEKIHDMFDGFMDRPLDCAVNEFIRFEQQAMDRKYRAHAYTLGESFILTDEEGKTYDEDYRFPQYSKELVAPEGSGLKKSYSVGLIYFDAGLDDSLITRKTLSEEGYDRAYLLHRRLSDLSTCQPVTYPLKNIDRLPEEKRDVIRKIILSLDSHGFDNLLRLPVPDIDDYRHRGATTGWEILDDVYDIPYDKGAGRYRLTDSVRELSVQIRRHSPWKAYSIPCIPLVLRYPQLASFLSWTNVTLYPGVERPDCDPLKKFLLTGGWVTHNFYDHNAMSALNEMVISQMYDRKDTDPVLGKIIETGVDVLADILDREGFNGQAARDIAVRMIPTKDNVTAAEDLVRAGMEGRDTIALRERLSGILQRETDLLRSGQELEPYRAAATEELAAAFSRRYGHIPQILPMLLTAEKIPEDSAYLLQVSLGNYTGKLTMDEIVKGFSVSRIKACAPFADPGIILLNLTCPVEKLTQPVKDVIYRHADTDNADYLIYLFDVIASKKNWNLDILEDICTSPDGFDRKSLEAVRKMTPYQYEAVGMEAKAEEDITDFEDKYDYLFSDNTVCIAGKDILVKDPKRHLRAYILSPGDPRNFTVGYSTNCCQHFDEAGESCTAAATQNPHSGIWIIENTRSGKIEAQAWVYEDVVQDIFVFDNIEFANDQEVENYRDILGAYVNALPHKNVHMGMGYNAETGLGVMLDPVHDHIAYIPSAYMGGEEFEDTYTDYDADAEKPEDRPRILKKDGQMLMECGDGIITGHTTGQEYTSPPVTYVSGTAYLKSYMSRFTDLIKDLRVSVEKEAADGWSLYDESCEYRDELKLFHDGWEPLAVYLSYGKIKGEENTVSITVELPQYITAAAGIKKAVYNPDTGMIRFEKEKDHIFNISLFRWDSKENEASEAALSDGISELAGRIKESLCCLASGDIKGCLDIFPDEKETHDLCSSAGIGKKQEQASESRLEEELDDLGLISHDDMDDEASSPEKSSFILTDPAEDPEKDHDEDYDGCISKTVSHPAGKEDRTEDRYSMPEPDYADQMLPFV